MAAGKKNEHHNNLKGVTMYFTIKLEYQKVNGYSKGLNV
jgi:hypothetical protein